MTAVTMKITPPTAEKIQSIVVPITIRVIPIALANGISVGAGEVDLLAGRVGAF